MSDIPTCNWVGASGTSYTYYIYALPASFGPDQPGNYIYAKLNSEGKWVPVYIGEGDLADRSGSGHHKAECIKRKGATHFHCHKNASEENRKKEEADLLLRYTNAYEPDGCNEKVGG
jgi:hypothetical protein